MERQDERRRKLSASRHAQQQPAEHETDRQAADVPEKEPCHRLVEGGKAQHRPEQRERNQRGQWRNDAQ
jgi:hypothetical protein